MSNPETILQTAIRLALGLEPDVLLYRNGIATVDRQTATGRRYKQRLGLGTGSADLIGMLTVDGRCVGHVVARFLALEVKTPRGVVTEDQRRFLELIRKRGGFACVVRSVPEAMAAISRARLGASE